MLTRAMLVVVLVGILSVAGVTGNVARAQPANAMVLANTCGTNHCSSYSCPGGNHCYAQFIFIGWVDGAQTSVSRVVNMYSPCCGGSIQDQGVTGNNFETDELWVVGSNGWVEAGMIGLADGTGTTHYFWADQRPGGGFHAHDFGIANAGDYGGQATFEIWRTDSLDWTAAVYTQTSGYYGYSTNNSMGTSNIQIGSELYGNGTNYPNASIASSVDFIGNMWDRGGNWHWQGPNLQSGSGDIYGNAPPPFKYLVSWPNGSANSGGDLQVWCC